MSDESEETPLVYQCSVPFLGLLIILSLRLMLERKDHIARERFLLLNACLLLSGLFLVFSDSSKPVCYFLGAIWSMASSGSVHELVCRIDAAREQARRQARSQIQLRQAFIQQQQEKQELKVPEAGVWMGQPLGQPMQDLYSNYYPCIPVQQRPMLMSLPMVANQPYLIGEEADGRMSSTPMHCNHACKADRQAAVFVSAGLNDAPLGKAPAIFAGVETAAQTNEQVTLISNCDQNAASKIKDSDYYTMEKRVVNVGTEQNPQLVDVVHRVPKKCFESFNDFSPERGISADSTFANPGGTAKAGKKDPCPDDPAMTRIWNLLVFANFLVLWFVATINFMYLRQLDQNTGKPFFPLPAKKLPPPPELVNPSSDPPACHLGTCSDVAQNIGLLLPWGP